MKSLSHRISIPSILKVGKNNLKHIGQLLKTEGFTNCMLIISEGIDELFGPTIINSIKSSGIEILDTKTYENIDFDFIGHEAFLLPTETEVIVAVGGGKAIDIASGCVSENLVVITMFQIKSIDVISGKIIGDDVERAIVETNPKTTVTDFIFRYEPMLYISEVYAYTRSMTIHSI